MKKRWICLVAAMATAMTAAGCGQGGTTPATENGAVGSAENGGGAAAAEKTVIRFQTWNPGEGPATDALIAQFEEENPDIDVEYVFMPYTDHVEKLKVDLAAGDAADVYGMQTGATYKEFRDFEMPLTSFVEEQYGKEWQEEYNAYCMSLLKTEDGEYYALPLGLTYAGFAWADNKMLEGYGLKVSANQPLAQLRKICQTLREQGQYPMTIGAKDAWINIDVWMNIANDINSEKLYSAIEGETPFTDEELVESFRIWQSLFADGVFQDGALGVGMYNDTTDLFQKEGSIPMIMNGSWAAGAFLDVDEQSQAVYNSPDSSHSVFLIDWNDDGKPAPVAASVDVCLCMNKNTKNPEAAYRFIDWMVHRGQDILINEYLQYCPSRTNLELNVKGLSANGAECLEFIVSQAEGNVAGYREMSYPELKQSIAEHLTLLALGDITPKDAAEAIEKISKEETVRE